ncbi:hypothetical protein QVD17_04966 [Tagetes erecta]|uniref:Uncharacterized protein n=1 Tax=Tagetes erecta TaxID=13708 RepID=A0AAD8LHN4_TARER|nr:hypothetical protein QVD17_04966 [Tagetes erecta]
MFSICVKGCLALLYVISLIILAAQLTSLSHLAVLIATNVCYAIIRNSYPVCFLAYNVVVLTPCIITIPLDCY